MNRLLEYIQNNHSEIFNEKLSTFIQERFDTTDETIDDANYSIPTVYQSGYEFSFDVKLKIRTKNNNNSFGNMF